MNFSRRQLFTRLSAIALAPLVKWLPKAAPSHIIACDIASGLDWGATQLLTHNGWVTQSASWSMARTPDNDAMVDLLVENGYLTRKPVPQEEA
jgi:hypothetical protein